MPLFARSTESTDLAAAKVARQATASLAGLMAARGTTRSQLAAAMGVSPGRVSQILAGEANLTVRSLAAAAQALDSCVEIRFFDPAQQPADQPTSMTGTDNAHHATDPLHQY